MIKGGYSRQDEVIDYVRKSDNTQQQFSKLIYSNEDIKRISNTQDVEYFIRSQQYNWISHCYRSNTSNFIKQLTFEQDTSKKFKKKPGITNTTHRQVIQYEKTKNKNFNENILKNLCVQKVPFSID